MLYYSGQILHLSLSPSFMVTNSPGCILPAPDIILYNSAELEDPFLPLDLKLHSDQLGGYT